MKCGQPASLRASLVTFLALAAPAAAQLGTSFCAGAPNSTGSPSALTATGELDPALNDLTLFGASLPAHALGYLLVSRERAFVPNAGGSSGNLCLGGATGRYVGSVFDAGPTGEATLPIDLSAIPAPSGSFAVVQGDSLNFQVWYRDMGAGGAATSNFSEGRALTFCPEPYFAGVALWMAPFVPRVQIADFDGDGAADLWEPSGVSVRLGRGDGTFEALVTSAVPYTASFAEPFDIDGDGDLDLVGSPQYNPMLVPFVMRYEGGGAFGAPAALPEASGAADLAPKDLDGDGDVDLLAVGLVADHLAVLDNDGAGNFTVMSSVFVGSGPQFARAGDLDGDGDPDAIVVLDRAAPLYLQTMQVMENIGGAYVLRGAYSVRPTVRDVLCEDVDADGDVDLVSWNFAAYSTIVVHHNVGGLAFAWESHFSLPASNHSIAHGDVDGDGDRDFVAATSDVEDPMLILLRSFGGGLFGYEPRAPVGAHANYIALGDLDGDGRPEVVASSSASLAHVRRGVDPATFEAIGRPIEPVTAILTGFTLLEAIDFEGDQRPELVYTGTTPPSTLGKFVEVLRSGDGWNQFERQHFEFPGANGLVMARGDFDGDGQIDIVVGTTTPGASLTVLRNVGGGRVAPLAPQPFVDYAVGLDAGDIDGDGDVDLLLFENVIEVHVLWNDGAGTFTSGAQVTGLVGLLTLVRLADLDADGDLDLIVRAENQPLRVHWNDGTGTFSLPATILEATNPQAVSMGDLDADADVDVVTLSSSSGGQRFVDVERNLGAGVFAPRERTVVPNTFEGLVAVDVEGDGDLDLVSFVPSASAAVVLENTGEASFLEARYSTTGAGSHTPCWTDLDGDGDVDLVVEVMRAPRLQWFENRCQ